MSVMFPTVMDGKWTFVAMPDDADLASIERDAGIELSDEARQEIRIFLSDYIRKASSLESAKRSTNIGKTDVTDHVNKIRRRSEHIRSELSELRNDLDMLPHMRGANEQLVLAVARLRIEKSGLRSTVLLVDVAAETTSYLNTFEGAITEALRDYNGRRPADIHLNRLIGKLAVLFSDGGGNVRADWRDSVGMVGGPFPQFVSSVLASIGDSIRCPNSIGQRIRDLLRTGRLQLAA